MCVDCVLASPRIAQVDPGDGPPSEVVLSHLHKRDIQEESLSDYAQQDLSVVT
jgi:hypothetical protein